MMSKSKELVQTSLKMVKQLKLLGVEIDDNLKFSPNVNSICSKAGGQLRISNKKGETIVPRGRDNK